MAMITCEAASFGYEGRAVIEDLNFEVNRADYVCVVGENGSGKSTFIKGLLHLLPPLSGRLTLGDGLGPGDIGYLPQQTPAQKDFPASVFEVVLSGRLGALGARPFYFKRDKQAALNNMALLGIGDLKDRCYRELSGGQQQRVLLSRALCAGKTLLVLDEPVSGLDPSASAQLYRVIDDVNRAGVTIIMVTHDVREAVRRAGSTGRTGRAGRIGRVLHIENRQAFFGTAEEYARSPAGRRFLGGEADD